jgi:hypothetical protein
MQHYTLTTATLSSSDVARTGTCIALPTGTLVEHFYLDPVIDPAFYAGTFGAQGPYLFDHAFFDNLSGIDQGTPGQCVRLRTRAADGSYSDPAVLCGTDAPMYRIAGSAELACTAEGLTHEGQLVTASDAGAGCSMAGARSSGSSLGLLGLACALTLAIRGSRRRRA